MKYLKKKMLSLFKKKKQFSIDEDGATAIEYGLIAGLISVAIIAGLGQVSNAINSLFTDITTELNNVTIDDGS